MVQEKYETIFTEKIPRVEATASYRFEKPPSYEYAAGQYFVLTIPAPDGESTLEKHFTHSSSPTEPFLEFTTRLTGSEFKNAVDALEEGTEVTIEGPYGEFTIQDDLERIVFMTGGIGITPARSILRYLADQGSSPQITLLYGNENEQRITFKDELAEVASVLPLLRVVHVLSDPSETWEGHRGYIDDAILAKEVERPEDWTYYISGPPAMVDAMTALLRRKNIPADSIVPENFQGY